MNSKVYIVRCEDYSQTTEKMGELFSLMGGTDRFVAPGERLLLKVNLLQPSPPEKAVTTHPAVAAAVAKLVVAQGASALIGDSPGAGCRYTEAGLKTLYAACGMDEAARLSGAQLNFDTSRREVSLPDGKRVKRMEILTPAAECDGVFNLCKLKTHMFMSMTGAVKNCFGIIPGLGKVGFHAKYQDRLRFANMLLDLSMLLSPRLSIMDAVVGMEGDGPGASGIPRKMGLLLASENPLALDVAAGEILGLPRERNPVLLAAEQRGFFPCRAEDLELVGPPLAELRIPDLRFPAQLWSGSLGAGKWWQKPASFLLKATLSQTPKVNTARCVGCGICRDACPAKAITVNAGKAAVNPRRCIRCYCCHELCPKKAIAIHKNTLSN